MSVSAPISQIDHVGYVVSDMTRAVRFFVDHLGFHELNRTGTLEDPTGDSMTRRFGVHPRAIGNYLFLGVGEDKVEFIQWTSPIQNQTSPLNSDFGGRHVALKAKDIGALAAHLATLDGIDVREPNDIGYIYVGTDFGLEVQLIPG